MDNFLRDLLAQLIDEATSIRENAESEFENGKLFAYYEVISKVLNQAEAFNIAKDLPSNLRDFPVEDLINK